METVENYSQAAGCATNLFDYYTTWSDAAFIAAIVTVGFLPRLKSTAANLFCVAAFSNMISVAIVGHLMANYLNVRANAQSVVTPLGVTLTTGKMQQVTYGPISIRIHDDIGHILPLLGSIIALVFLKLQVRLDWSYVWICWLLIAAYIALYLAIPFFPPKNPTSYCEGTSYSQTTWWNKILKVYYAEYLWLSCIALLLVPALVLTILIIS